MNGAMMFTVEKYISKSKGNNQRYNSWNHCFEAFGNLNDDKVLSLHLAFYLASWGMYRGSSKLLNFDFLIHIGAVRLLHSYNSLRCSSECNVADMDLVKILDLIDKLSKYYKEKGITPTDTLISKIILGTLGCLPAYDRFFIEGVKHHNKNFRNLNKKSLQSLFNYVIDHKELITIQKAYPEYPLNWWIFIFGKQDTI